MSLPAIRIKNLSVSFNGRVVLDRITASIPEGGCTVFVGPNGAGKTTLLLCLVGEVSCSGELTLDSSFHGHVGYVPQNLRFDPQTPLTVDEFLAMGISRRPLWSGIGHRVRKDIDGMLTLVGMAKRNRFRLGDLSGGEMRRILLALALLRNPKLLLLDEPAAGVDPKGEHLFWEILEEARRSRGLTIVMVSHNLPLTAHYATHVLCLSRGQCLEGAPHVTLTAKNLMNIFGIPIHLYPDQCTVPQFFCPKCGAFGLEDKEGESVAASVCKLTHGGVKLAGELNSHCEGRAPERHSS